MRFWCDCGVLNETALVKLTRLESLRHVQVALWAMSVQLMVRSLGTPWCRLYDEEFGTL